MYSNISQMLLLYKTWRYYNKFDSTKPLGVRYQCIKIPECGWMEHGLKDIFYVQKHMTSCTVVITSLLVRDKPLGLPASVKRVYSAWHVYIWRGWKQFWKQISNCNWPIASCEQIFFLILIDIQSIPLKMYWVFPQIVLAVRQYWFR